MESSSSFGCPPAQVKSGPGAQSPALWDHTCVSAQWVPTGIVATCSGLRKSETRSERHVVWRPGAGAGWGVCCRAHLSQVEAAVTRNESGGQTDWHGAQKVCNSMEG